MNRFKINAVTSDIIISVYVLVSLFLRFKYESEGSVSTLESLVIGLGFVSMLWALIKLKILNPNWFGLFNTRSPRV